MPALTQHTLERNGPKGGGQASASELARMATRYQEVHPGTDRATAYVAVRNMTPMQYGRMSRGILTPEEKQARRRAAWTRNQKAQQRNLIHDHVEAFCLDQMDRVRAALRRPESGGDQDYHLALGGPSRVSDFDLVEYRR